jgi:hypothetical protein
MGGTCSTCGGYEKCIQKFSQKAQRVERDLCIDEGIILKWLLKRLWE